MSNFNSDSSIGAPLLRVSGASKTFPGVRRWTTCSWTFGTVKCWPWWAKTARASQR